MEERNHRFEAFKDKLTKLDVLNAETLADDGSAGFGITKFADIYEWEFGKGSISSNIRKSLHAEDEIVAEL